MKIIETEDEIILRYVPFGHWAVGCLSTPFVGIFIIALIGSAIENPRAFLSSMDGGWLGKIFAYLMSGVCFGILLLTLAGLASFLFTPIKTTKINRQTKSIEIKTRGLFKNRTQVFYFTQIREFASNKTAIRGVASYSVVLVLDNRKQISLENRERSAGKTEEIIQKLNSFIKT